jgi:hypothetical protein
MTSGQETTMTSGQDVSEYLDCSDAPEDESISLFAGLLANPICDFSLIMTLSPNKNDLCTPNFWMY